MLYTLNPAAAEKALETIAAEKARARAALERAERAERAAERAKGPAAILTEKRRPDTKEARAEKAALARAAKKQAAACTPYAAPVVPLARWEELSSIRAAARKQAAARERIARAAALTAENIATPAAVKEARAADLTARAVNERAIVKATAAALTAAKADRRLPPAVVDYLTAAENDGYIPARAAVIAFYAARKAAIRRGADRRLYDNHTDDMLSVACLAAAHACNHKPEEPGPVLAGMRACNRYAYQLSAHIVEPSIEVLTEARALPEDVFQTIAAQERVLRRSLCQSIGARLSGDKTKRAAALKAWCRAVINGEPLPPLHAAQKPAAVKLLTAAAKACGVYADICDTIAATLDGLNHGPAAAPHDFTVTPDRPAPTDSTVEWSEASVAGGHALRTARRPD